MIAVYEILNKLDGKYYIGSSINVEKRKNTHFKLLVNGTHPNTYLQNAVNKYGINNFEFLILQECNINDVRTVEEYYIQKYHATDHNFGYNILSLTNIGLGVSASEEIRKKISCACSGINNGNFGRKHTEQELKIMHDIRWGEHYIKKPRKKYKIKSQIKYTPEERSKRAKDRVTDATRLKISKSKIGTHPSDEVRLKLSKSKTGIKNPNNKLNKEQVLKIYNLINNGVHYSDICKMFNVSVSCVYRIKNKENWVFKNDK